jgi:phosphopantothenoylcysteine decarboxylase/phosphopantothenate--cysteine ligase
VESAAQMREAVLSAFPSTDIVIKAAAVADYRPETAEPQKIKKNSASLTLVLTKNPDILAELGQLKQSQFLVGFAAETQDLIAHATDKLRRKNVDMLVANDVTMSGAGFESDTNIVKILFPDGTVEELPQMSKQELGQVILDRVLARRSESTVK